ncbi:MAG: DUF1127 domain-containing protein [Rhizobacter sp.]
MRYVLPLVRPWWQRLPVVANPSVLIAWYRRVQRRAREHRELRALDVHTLRDLGVHSSELVSFDTESHGQAERTRRRVAVRSEWR